MNPVSYVPATYDTAAINAAIASASATGCGIVDLPGGVYSPYDSAGNLVPIVGASNITLRGARGATIIRIDHSHPITFNAYLVNGIGCDDFHVIDITFDMGDIDPPDDNWPMNASGAIILGSNGTTGGTDCSVENCKIINAGRYGIVTRGGTRGLHLLYNKVRRTAPSGAGNIAIMLRKDGGAVNVLPKIIGNETESMCGFCGASWYGKYIANDFRGSGFGGNMVFDADLNCSGNIIIGNAALGGVSLAPGFGSRGFEDWGTSSLHGFNAADGNAGAGVTLAGRDASAIGLRASNNRDEGIYVFGTSAHNAFIEGCKTRGNGGPPYKVDPGIVGTVVGLNDLR
jgi:hypothetical protein